MTALRSSTCRESTGDSFARARTVPNISGLLWNCCTVAWLGTTPTDATGVCVRFLGIAPPEFAQAPGLDIARDSGTREALLRAIGEVAQNALGRAAGAPARRQRIQPDCRR